VQPDLKAQSVRRDPAARKALPDLKDLLVRKVRPDPAAAL
jgi:hypothetical protein